MLRAIQAEYGAAVRRQVTAGRDSGFDGLLISNGRTTVIEVKYVPAARSSQRFRPSIQRLTETVLQYGWPNPQIILAVVFEREEDVKNSREFFAAAFSENPVSVTVRIFTLDQLKAQFGVSDQNG